MWQMTTLDTVGGNQLITRSNSAIWQRWLLHQRLDRVPQNGRIVSLTVQREPETAVDFAQLDAELPVVVGRLPDVWNHSLVNVVVVEGDGGEEIEIIGVGRLHQVWFWNEK